MATLHMLIMEIQGSHKSGAGAFQGKKNLQSVIKAKGPISWVLIGAHHGSPQVRDELAVLHELQQLLPVHLPHWLRAPGVVCCKKLSSMLVSPVKFVELHYKNFQRDQVYSC